MRFNPIFSFACRIAILRHLHGMLLSPTSVKDALQSSVPVAPIQVQGWVRTRRDSQDFSFVELHDGGSLRNLQMISKNSLPHYAEVQGPTNSWVNNVPGQII